MLDDDQPWDYGAQKEFLDAWRGSYSPDALYMAMNVAQLFSA